MKNFILLFAIAMMAVTTASAKVYESDLNDAGYISSGDSQIFDGIKFYCIDGEVSIDPTGLSFLGYSRDENCFTISTESEETMTSIEITCNPIMLYGAWTKTTTGIKWEGTAISVNVGMYLENVTHIKIVCEEQTPTHIHAFATDRTKTETKVCKRFVNGKLYIVMGNKVYDATGKEIK